uniref:aa3-type cytochrome oxidase subunit II n=1 Tax=Aestuariimicrobium ganziense TaxID=2773677 RepID=UPI001F3D0275|nr:cytochrome c oxidase subunit II [Aestuariimicrobium ganziense]
MGNLWVGAWIASLVIGVLVWGLIFYAIIRYRRRPGNEVPRQTKYHLPMEILYTLVPFLIIGVLFFFTIRAQNTVLAKEDAPPHTINVVAQKWSWTFNYMEQDNPDVGATVHTVGTMSDLPTLVLPVGETVRFNLASADVIHSFWIPAFYFKLDVIPGHPNSFDVTPSKIGDYDGKCAELCGTYHANMLFKVKVVSVDDYNAHLKKLASEGKTGEILPPAAATHLPSTPTASATKEEGE